MSGGAARAAPAWRVPRGRARVTLPVTGGDTGPDGLARGPVEVVQVTTRAYDPRTGVVCEVLQPQPVVRRRRGLGLQVLDEQGRRIAERYAALVEMASSPGGPGDGVRGGGLSDGGATTRCRVAGKVRAARAAVGAGVWRPGRGMAGAHQADRGQGVPVAVLALVDAVCLGGRSVPEVLRAQGWADRRAWREELARLLREAVDRMGDVIGY